MTDLLYEKREHYAVITLNRPERLNALGGNLWQELSAAMEDFINDPEIRAGIVTGTGDRAFYLEGYALLSSREFTQETAHCLAVTSPARKCKSEYN